MSIEELVLKYFDPCAVYMVEGKEAMRAALTEQAEAYEQRIRELEAQMVPEGWKLVPSRCPLCEYQHGHRIGCDNNSVDIALRDAASAPKEDTNDR